MGHKAQLPSGEAVCCCRALCIMCNIPVVASVCGHSCSSAELLHKVFQGCSCFFFFLLDFSTFLLCEGTIWHSYYIRTCRQFPLRQLHRSRAARQRRKWRREEGEKVGEITFKNKISEYSGFVSWDRQLPLTPTTPVVVCRSLLSLRGTRCWYGGLALCSPPWSAMQEDWTCRALSAMALLKGTAVGSLLWL